MQRFASHRRNGIRILSDGEGGFFSENGTQLYPSENLMRAVAGVALDFQLL
jgi:hypothetical protein